MLPEEVLRFWSKTRREGDCLLWAGPQFGNGYGMFQPSRKAMRPRRMLLAHRVAYELAYGPPQHQVCHQCDVRLCVEPTHLFDGTQQDNMQDMIRKGRAATGDAKRHLGEAHGRAKLSNEKVLAIRASHETCKVLAERYGVTPSLVAMVKRREVWRHV